MLAAVVVVLVMGAGAGGWCAASAFQSPAQREADAAAPSPGAVTVPVVTETLEETASARGTVRRVSSETVALPAGAGTTVVTAATTPAGAVVEAGQVLSELNGRPLIAMPGQFAYYRDLTPGDAGPDVVQLQSALVAAGYPLRADGAFGPATERAVRALYRHLGYSVLEEEEVVEEERAVQKDAEREDVQGVEPDTDADPPASEGATTDDEAPTAAVTSTGTATATATSTATATATRRLTVPAAELTAVASLPAVAASVAGVGTVAGTERATIALSSGELVAEVEVAASLAMRLAQDTPATVDRDDGTQVPCEIVVVPDLAEDATTALVQVRPAQGYSDDWLGAVVVAVFVLQEVSEESLVVPTGAVVPGGNDLSQVLVQQQDGSFRAVPVTELGTLGGRTAVAPVQPDALTTGDLVKVA